MSNRIASLDALRIALVTLVIAHHAAQAFVPTGTAWNIGPWPVRNGELAEWMGPFMAVNSGFFMGLFFWIAGYLTPGAVDRKGVGAFFRERALRLGVPLLVYFLLLSVPITYYSAREGPRAMAMSLPRYYLTPWQWDWVGIYMHLWFLGHLLVFAGVYALWRAWRRRAPAPPPARVPGHGVLLGTVVVLAAVSAAVQTVYRHDVWVFVGIPIEMARLPQYVAMFVLGIAAARADWWRRLPTRVGRAWLAIGIVAAAVAYLPLLPGARAFSVMYPGGLDWRTALFALWEAFVTVGLITGLLILFRDHVTRLSAFGRELAASSYTVYIVHFLLVIFLQVALVATPWGVNAKYLAVFVLAWPASFLLAGGLRRLPGARRVL